MPRGSLAGMVGLVFLAGCADLENTIEDVTGRDEGPRTVAFDCDDDREFRARLSDDRDEVRVDVGDERYELDYIDREDGRRVYGNRAGVRLAVSDDDAYLRIPGEPDFQDCERS